MPPGFTTNLDPYAQNFAPMPPGFTTNLDPYAQNVAPMPNLDAYGGPPIEQQMQMPSPFMNVAQSPSEASPGAGEMNAAYKVSFSQRSCALRSI